MSKYLPNPTTGDYDMVARATPASMLIVVEILMQGLNELQENDANECKSEDFARANRLVKMMHKAATVKLNDLVELQKEKQRAKLTNPAQLPAFLEDGTCAKSFYESKGIRVVELEPNGDEFQVDLPLFWSIKYSPISNKWVLFTDQKKRVGSFLKPLKTFDF